MCSNIDVVPDLALDLNHVVVVVVDAVGRRVGIVWHEAIRITNHSAGGERVVWESERELEARRDRGLHILGSTLVATIRVFVEDGSVVLLRVSAALQHERHERSKLSPGITGVVDVCRSLIKLACMSTMLSL